MACCIVGKVAVVLAPEEPTEKKGDQHVHLRRLIRTDGHCDLPSLTLAPPPVLLAYALDHASRMSVEKDAGETSPAPSVFGSCDCRSSYLIKAVSNSLVSYEHPTVLAPCNSHSKIVSSLLHAKQDSADESPIREVFLRPVRSRRVPNPGADISRDGEANRLNCPPSCLIRVPHPDRSPVEIRFLMTPNPQPPLCMCFFSVEVKMIVPGNSQEPQ